MQELSRIAVSAGIVAASVGLVIYAIGASYHIPGDFEMNVGLWLMILGAIATIVGGVIYSRTWLEAQDD
jgi:hypothetical protein